MSPSVFCLSLLLILRFSASPDERSFLPQYDSEPPKAAWITTARLPSAPAPPFSSEVRRTLTQSTRIDIGSDSAFVTIKLDSLSSTDRIQTDLRTADDAFVRLTVASTPDRSDSPTAWIHWFDSRGMRSAADHFRLPEECRSLSLRFHLGWVQLHSDKGPVCSIYRHDYANSCTDIALLQAGATAVMRPIKVEHDHPRKELSTPAIRKLERRLRVLEEAGNPDAALRTAQQLMHLRWNSIEPDDPHWALLTLRTAYLQWSADQLPQAIASFRNAAEKLARTVGPDHPACLRATVGLATALLQVGDTPQAESLIRDVIKRADADIMPVETIRTLADVCLQTNRLNEAEELLRSVLPLTSNTLPADAAEAAAVNTLAFLRYHQNQFPEAVRLLSQAARYYEARKQTESPAYARQLCDLGILHFYARQPNEALRVLTTALSAIEQSHNNRHDLKALVHGDLTRVLHQQNRLSEAAHHAALSLSAHRRSAEEQLPYLPTWQADAWIRRRDYRADHLLSLLYRIQPRNPAAAYNSVWFTKEAVSFNCRPLIPDRDAPVHVIRKLSELATVRRELAHAIHSGADLPADRRTIESLTGRKEELLSAVLPYCRQSDPYDPTRLSEPSDLIRYLPPNVAVLDFHITADYSFRAFPYGARGERNAVLDVFILRNAHNTQEISWMRLGEIVPIRKLISEFRQTIGGSSTGGIRVASSDFAEIA